MAWPISPLTTYVSTTTPAIKAADLNSIQNAINQALLGTYSYKAISIDGTGGNAVTPTAGTFTATGQVSGGTLIATTVGSGTSVPTPAPTRYAGYQECLPFAMLNFTANGAGATTFTWGFNINSVSRSSAGVYSFSFVTAMSNASQNVVLVTLNSSPGSDFVFGGIVNNTTTAEVFTTNSSGTPTDVTAAFCVVIYAK